MREEIAVKGIIIETAPQGEYGKRIRLLTDTLGKITVFAKGASKQGSKIMGLVRPAACARFSLVKGRSAYSISGIEMIDAFDDLSFYPDAAFNAMYILEAGEYFAAEGMDERDAKSLLNLMFVALTALRNGELPFRIIRRVFELRLLVIAGEYSRYPEYAPDTATVAIWEHCLKSHLTKLFDPEAFKPGGDGPAVGSDAAIDAFSESVSRLFSKQTGNHRFKSLKVIEGL